HVVGHDMASAPGPAGVIEFRQMLFTPDECRLSGLERSGKQAGAPVAERAQNRASRRSRLRIAPQKFHTQIVEVPRRLIIDLDRREWFPRLLAHPHFKKFG